MAIYIVHIKLILWSFPHSSAGKESTCNGDPSSIPGSGRFPGEEIGYPLQYPWASLVAQLIKKPPAMRETWVWSLGWVDPLETGKATHSSILASRISWTVGIVHGVAESGGTTKQLSLSQASFCFKAFILAILHA